MMDLPCLDTKTYKKILEESIGRIPSITNRWTDFNPQDTGILLLEIMAGSCQLPLPLLRSWRLAWGGALRRLIRF